MAVAMAAFATVAVCGAASRVRWALAGAVAIAALSPLVANLPWDGAPPLLREYLAPIPGRGRFPFFPYASYLGFGLAMGAIVKRAAAERFERLMQWSLVIGLGAIFVSQYFANLPYSIYSRSSFWTDSPALIFIRTGHARRPGLRVCVDRVRLAGVELAGDAGQDFFDGVLGARGAGVRRAGQAPQARPCRFRRPRWLPPP